MHKTILAGLGFLIAPFIGTATAADMPKMEADTNGDGYVTKAEYMQYHDQRFDKADVDEDGSVTFEEVRAFAEQERERLQRKMQITQ